MKRSVFALFFSIFFILIFTVSHAATQDGGIDLPMDYFGSDESTKESSDPGTGELIPIAPDEVYPTAPKTSTESAPENTEINAVDLTEYASDDVATLEEVPDSTLVVTVDTEVPEAEFDFNEFVEATVETEPATQEQSNANKLLPFLLADAILLAICAAVILVINLKKKSK